MATQDVTDVVLWHLCPTNNSQRQPELMAPLNMVPEVLCLSTNLNHL